MYRSGLQGSSDLEPAKMGGAADDLLARIERLERIVEVPSFQSVRVHSNR